MGQPIVVDVYERERRLLDALRGLGVRFVRRALPLGDYEVRGVVVERKRVGDFHQSIISRRLWRQVARLRAGRRPAYVLVEGDDIDDGPLRPEAVRGALLALAELGIPVLHSSDADDSALWLAVLARRPERRARRYVPARPRLATPAEAVLCSVPGISLTTARALLHRYGSVAEIASLDRRDWLSVPGVGPARADALDEALRHGRRAAPSRARSARPDPST